MANRKSGGRGRRKRRTRQHVLEDLSENHLEHKVLLCGHVLRRPERDYGVDVTMFHFDQQGRIENGEVRFQLKATDKLTTTKRGEIVTYPIKIGDLHYWSREFYPFILVIFDAKASRGYWLNVQDYVTENPGIDNAGQDTVNVHVPIVNELTVESIKLFRQRSLETIERLRQQGGTADAARKPR
jgi:hypothetical protein